MRLATLATATILGSILAPTLALAQASVQFRITDSAGRPLDGRVTMTGQPGTLGCSTTASRCTVVATAGTYTVTVAPVREAAPAPRTLVVPPSGALTVAFATRPASGAALVGAGAVRTAVRPVTATPLSTGVRVVTPTPTPTATGTTTGGTPTATATATRVTTTSTAYVAVRSLGSGRTLVVQGSVMDTAGRPVDATITVSGSGGTVGSVSSTAGRFSMFDLPPGTYTFASRSTRGTTANMTVTLAAGTVSRLTVRVP